MNLPYAERLGHYWKTGKSSPDVLMDKTRKVITEFGGIVKAEGFGSAGGREAYMFVFEVGEDTFKVVWPVLPTKTGDIGAARRQAATLLHYDIKAKALSAGVLGVKSAFFSYLLLPDGRVTSEVAAPELGGFFPILLPEHGL